MIQGATTAVASLLSLLLWFYMWIIIIRALLSWVNVDPHHPIVQFLYQVTEPVLRPIRDLLPTSRIGLDLSPVIVIPIIWFLQHFLIRLPHFLFRMMG